MGTHAARVILVSGDVEMFKLTWFIQMDARSLDLPGTYMNMARALGRLGINVRLVVLYYGSKPRIAHDGLVLTMFKAPRCSGLSGITYKIRAFFLAFRDIVGGTDVIMTDFDTVFAMVPFGILSKIGLLRTKFIMDIRSMRVDIFGLRRRVIDRLYDLAVLYVKHFFDGITVITDLYRDDICRRHRIDPGTVGVWSSAVDVDEFDPGAVNTDEVEDLRRKYELNGKVVVIYHGVLSLNRGLSQAVKAFAALREKGIEDVVFILLGDGDGAVTLRRLVKDLSLQEAVRVLNPVRHDEVPVYVMLADAGILPFPDIRWWNMSSPLKLMEYLAMGKRVILTDIAAHRAAVSDNPCAYFAASSSVAALEAAIRKCCEEARGSKGVCEAARKLALDEYTWELQARRLKQYLDSVVI